MIRRPSAPRSSERCCGCSTGCAPSPSRALLGRARLLAADDVAVVVDARRHRLVLDLHPEDAARASAAGEARAALDARGDAVTQYVGAGLDRGHLPGELLRLPGLQAAQRPRVGGRGVAALGSLVDDPD